MSDFTSAGAGSNGPLPYGPRPEAVPGPATATVPRFPPPRLDQPGPQAPAGAPAGAAEVKGRIQIADEVVEKVAGLAAVEVDGVAGIGGRTAPAGGPDPSGVEAGGPPRTPGVRAEVKGHEVAVDVAVTVEYGHVVLDVARKVQLNVARKTHRMLGLGVVEVNVTVDDVRTTATDRSDRPEPEAGAVAPS